MIVDARGLGKSYRSKRAVDDLSFVVQPGRVTGFLGPNGSGKSTTMRLMLGLDHGDGTTTFDGRPLREHDRPTSVVGAHLDAKSFHPQRTARQHLRLLAAQGAVPDSRVDEVIGIVGLDTVADKRPGAFSLGMAQRLGLAGALLADPQVLMLDEPANGLDPQSIQWLRQYLQHFAGQGRAVFVSSHLLSEMQLMADDLVVIGRGRLVQAESMADFVRRSTRNDVLVRVSDPARLADALRSAGASVSVEESDGLAVQGMSTDEVGDVAFAQGVVVRELTARTASLEEAFLELTADAQEYVGRDGAAPAGAA